MTTNVPMMETGIDTQTFKVELIDPKNINATNAVSTTPMTSECLTSSISSLINKEKSVDMPISTPSGARARKIGSLRFTSSQT